MIDKFLSCRVLVSQPMQPVTQFNNRWPRRTAVGTLSKCRRRGLLIKLTAQRCAEPNRWIETRLLQNSKVALRSELKLLVLLTLIVNEKGDNYGNRSSNPNRQSNPDGCPG